MLEINSIADFWDCEIEHAEAKKKWVSEHLLYIISTKAGRWNLDKFEVLYTLIDMAVSRATKVEWEIGDRILTFADGSNLAIVAPGANTMAGHSRVMALGEQGVRDTVRGGRRYIHGSTRTAWHWTRNGKAFGKPAPIFELTGNICPKDGLWVRRFCEKGCSDGEVSAEQISAGDILLPCSQCASTANFGWAAP